MFQGDTLKDMGRLAWFPELFLGKLVSLRASLHYMNYRLKRPWVKIPYPPVNIPIPTKID